MKNKPEPIPVKHTPGKWRVAGLGAPTPKIVSKIAGETETTDILIAEVARGWAPGYEAESDANAQLMAAVPKMIRLLQEAENLYTTFLGGVDMTTDRSKERIANVLQGIDKINDIVLGADRPRPERNETKHS